MLNRDRLRLFKELLSKLEASIPPTETEKRSLVTLYGSWPPVTDGEIVNL